MASKQEWYKDGLSFQCTHAALLHGTSRAVWFNDKEAEEMAAELGMDIDDFMSTWAADSMTDGP